MVERRLTRTVLTASLLAVTMAVGACAAGGEKIEVTDVRVGRPTGPNAALYFTASTGGIADRLLGAETVEAASVEIHESVESDDGSTGMRSLDALDLPAGGSLVLEPGGSHLMLVDVSRLETGDAIDITLLWEEAGRMDIKAQVVSAADTAGDSD